MPTLYTPFLARLFDMTRAEYWTKAAEGNDGEAAAATDPAEAAALRREAAWCRWQSQREGGPACSKETLALAGVEPARRRRA